MDQNLATARVSASAAAAAPRSRSPVAAATRALERVNAAMLVEVRIFNLKKTKLNHSRRFVDSFCSFQMEPKLASVKENANAAAAALM